MGILQIFVLLAIVAIIILSVVNIVRLIGVVLLRKQWQSGSFTSVLNLLTIMSGVITYYLFSDELGYLSSDSGMWNRGLFFAFLLATVVYVVLLFLKTLPTRVYLVYAVAIFALVVAMLMQGFNLNDSIIFVYPLNLLLLACMLAANQYYLRNNKKATE